MKKAVLLVDHGSRRAEANAVLEAVARLLRERLPEHVVEIAHMELASPSVAEGIAACVDAGARKIIVHPYFLAPGSHSTSDIPRLVREALATHPGVEARITAPIGVHPQLIDVIVDRIDDCGAARTPCVGDGAGVR